MLGAEVLGLLEEPCTVSSLWENVQVRRRRFGETNITFDWFVLTLDFLFIVKAIELENKRIARRAS